MASFFEKLKKGMGVEITDEEPEKTEKTEEKPPKESKLPTGQAPVVEHSAFTTGQAPVVEHSAFTTGQAKPSLKKRKIKKIESKEDKSSSPPFATARVIEADLINTGSEKTEKEEPKKSEPREPEEKIESKQEIKKTSPINIAQKEEKKLESSRHGFTLQNLGGQEGQLAVDVYQTDAELVIQSTIAGVKAENLDISIEADTILIRGNRQEPEEQGEKNYFYQECYWGPFSWQKILPVETDPSRASAELKEGILTIRIPKIEREKKRKITIKG